MCECAVSSSKSCQVCELPPRAAKTGGLQQQVWVSGASPLTAGGRFGVTRAKRVTDDRPHATTDPPTD